MITFQWTQHTCPRYFRSTEDDRQTDRRTSW